MNKIKQFLSNLYNRIVQDKVLTASKANYITRFGQEDSRNSIIKRTIKSIDNQIIFKASLESTCLVIDLKDYNIHLLESLKTHYTNQGFVVQMLDKEKYKLDTEVMLITWNQNAEENCD